MGRLVLAAAAFAVGLSGSAAMASIIDISATGEMLGGSYAGAPGDPISIHMSFDTTLGTTTTTSTEVNLAGGAGQGTSPNLGASILSDGFFSVDFVGNYSGLLSLSQCDALDPSCGANAGLEGMTASAQSLYDDGTTEFSDLLYFSVAVFADMIAGDLTTAFTWAAGPYDAGFGCTVSSQHNRVDGSTSNRSACFSITSLVYAVDGIAPPVSPVPLPASGGLILAGLAGLALLRRRTAR